MAGDFKRMYKQMHDEKLGTSPYDLQMLGPPTSITQPYGVSPTLIHSRSLTDDSDTNVANGFSGSIISRKTLFYLISTLNASFQPDYDFSNTSSSEFSKEPSIDFVIKSVENHLSTTDVYVKYKQQLWDSIDKEINLTECEFYR
jgi:hypothetical protein